MLSHHEDRELRAIEQWFEESDPALTRMLRDHEAPRRPHLRPRTQVAIDIIGAALFVLGASFSEPALVMIGFLLIIVAVSLHLAAGGPPRHGLPPH